MNASENFVVKSYEIMKIEPNMILIDQGNKITSTYNNFKLMIDTIYLGDCPMANYARHIGNLSRKISYDQHMTLAVVREWND